MPEAPAKPKYFATLDAWRAWLATHHARDKELWVGFWKRGSCRPSITWPESVDGALAYGWIDGVRKSLGADAYVIRFTPRRSGSIWSAVNIKRVAEIEQLGLMTDAGRRAFALRSDDKSAIYAYEQRHTAELEGELAERFRANAEAHMYFQAQPPGYKHIAAYWVLSAKRPDTRDRRLATLIACSKARRRLPSLTPPGKK
jgi:uncharacterized protein YdeI (YjbR/CyaY-like superfamily)